MFPGNGLLSGTTATLDLPRVYTYMSVCLSALLPSPACRPDLRDGHICTYVLLLYGGSLKEYLHSSSDPAHNAPAACDPPRQSLARHRHGGDGRMWQIAEWLGGGGLPQTLGQEILSTCMREDCPMTPRWAQEKLSEPDYRGQTIASVVRWTGFVLELVYTRGWDGTGGSHRPWERI